MAENGVRYKEQRLIPADPEAIFEILRTPAELVMLDPSGCLMEATGGPVDAVDDRVVARFDPQAMDFMSEVMVSALSHADFPMPDEIKVDIANMTFEQKREFFRDLSEEITADGSFDDLDFSSVFDVEIVVSRYERNRSIAWKVAPLEETDMSFLFDVRNEGGFDLEAVDGGTRVISWEVEWGEWEDDITDDIKTAANLRKFSQLRIGLAMLARTVAQRTGHTG